MAKNTSSEAPEPAEIKADAKIEPKKEPVFSLERLARDSYKLFGVTPSTFAGATCELPKDKQYTVEKIKESIKKWLETPVKIGKAVKK